MNTVQEFFNTFDDSCYPLNRIDFEWCAKGVGFGGINFYIDDTDGYVHCRNETMSRDFLKRMLCNMVDNCVLDEPLESLKSDEIFPPDYPTHPITK